MIPRLWPHALALPCVTLLAACFIASPAHAAERDAPACTAKVGPADNLQGAINDLPNDGSPAVLCLGAGDYQLQGLIALLRDNTTLRGAGPKTVLHMRDNVQQPLLVVGDSVDQIPVRPIQNVTISDITFIGGKAEKEFMPERPYLSNSAVVVRRGINVRLTRLKASNCRSACLLTEQHSTDITLDHNEVFGAIWDGVSFNSTSKVKMHDNHVHDNVAAGITAEEINDSEIRDNILSNNGSQGAYLSNSRNNLFVGNTFSGNHGAGVFLTCAIRFRNADGSTQCWDNSVSQNNTFDANHFDKDPFTYTIGVDKAANCTSADFKPNIWKASNQATASGVDLDPQRYGYCVRHEP
ncbi:parallel beta-helix repeat (two copies) [Pseudoxanthomonas sp. GM95]|uniref:right-handed parallel beta-helix repeat-containing protein n=1 Tax=Pseudoxanthomonas sp. GM95 TaxID=1881043 RepID=UPI0008C0A648|nr:right-handed parallel beta-helix repeat-containing protein [Pseudoxanthomonas sp. GM95]SEL80872.1 parallel beta-helix repeat (two copies) [Pseudoxanthomonas sp. GM95]